MKILYTTDLHGDAEKYKRLEDIALKARPAIVINGGDMLPKKVNLFQQDKFITGRLTAHFEFFQTAGIQYLCCPGNDDLKIFDDLFDETCNRFPLVTNLAQRRVEISGHEFIGMNWVVDYPFRLKDRCRKDKGDYVFQAQMGSGLLSSEMGWRELADWQGYAATLPTIEDELQRLPRPLDMSRAIYVIHMPPYRLGLDKCRHGAEVGSAAVYEFLLKQQPLLSLHGHIHESPEVTKVWKAKLGNTVCIQPGQLEDEFTYVLIDLVSMQFEKSPKGTGR